jgi:hypothetical protein
LPADSDGAWWNDWAILLGATITSTGPLAELARLKRVEEGVKTSRIELLVKRYSDPALRCARASLDSSSSGLRPSHLHGCARQLCNGRGQKNLRSSSEIRRRLTNGFRTTANSGSARFPVTKLLGDLACCTPDGIEIESIKLWAPRAFLFAAFRRRRATSSLRIS